MMRIPELSRPIEGVVAIKDNPLRPNVLALAPSDEYILDAQLTPTCFVENYLYADVGTIIAPGATGKTTALLYESICLALAIPVWGNKVLKPGWTLIVTAEDARERLIARMREIMQGMELSAEQTRKAFDDVLIHDVSSIPSHALTRMMDGNIVPTELADLIISGCRQRENPAQILLDPMVSFGASEAMVNDNEQRLINVSRKIVSEIECAVRFVHHTGKSVDRVANGDQYSGRGGSAMADGCRMVMIMSAFTESTKDKPPAGCHPVPSKSLVILHRAKMSYCAPNQPKIWIQRDGWKFEHFLEFVVSKDQQAKQFEAQIVRFVEHQLEQGCCHTARSLKSMSEKMNMTVREADLAIPVCQSSGALVSAPAPKWFRQGGRTSILVPPNWYNRVGELESVGEK